VSPADDIAPSGNEAFDRARLFLARLREEEALDWFQIAADDADDPAIRCSAAAFVAGILLGRGRPWEVSVWAAIVRQNAARPDLGDLLEAAAHLQLGEVDAARRLLDRVIDPTDPWFPASVTSARVARAHVLYLDGAIDDATGEVLGAFDSDPYAPDVWDAFARLCAETEFDPTDFVARVPDDRILEVLASLRASAPAGVDRIAELIWERKLGDPRVLALVPSFAAKLESLRAMEWSARIRAAGMGRLCPLMDRAEDRLVDAPERVRAAALAHASFGDGRARGAITKAVEALNDDELVAALREVWTLAAMLADAAVVAGATTPARSLLIASVLFEGGARSEAYSVLVHGLSLDAAEGLTTEIVVELLPLPVLEGLAAEAEERGEQDVAGILEAVAVVSASS
jgi:tetratricopeptide (TPR) repeat protein